MDGDLFICLCWVDINCNCFKNEITMTRNRTLSGKIGEMYVVSESGLFLTFDDDSG
jgi:hypothetical protein